MAKTTTKTRTPGTGGATSFFHVWKRILHTRQNSGRWNLPTTSKERCFPYPDLDRNKTLINTSTPTSSLSQGPYMGP